MPRSGRSAARTAPGSPQEIARRHPRLRPDRAVPARPGRHRGHGQRAATTSTSSAGASCTRVDAHFSDEAHLRRTIDKIVSRIGRRVDESSPMVDARLPDGSRVNAVIPPLAIDGSAADHPQVLRRPATPSTTWSRFGSFTPADGGLPRRLRPRPAQHHRLRRHRRRKDDDAQRAVVVHPRRRAHRHHRGRRRAPAQPGARAPPRVAPGQHRGQGCGRHPRPGEELPAHASRPHRRR